MTRLSLAFTGVRCQSMYSMGLRLLFAAILIGVFPTEFLLADVVHVRDYQSHEAGDRGVLFTFVVTPEQDVLSLVAKPDGKWRLTRLQRWLEKRPADQTIDVPGWPIKRAAANDSEFLALLDVGLFVAADGRYAVCVATGHWARNGERGGRSDDVVSVVDLRTFRIVKTIHTSDVDHENWQLFMNPSGHLVLQTKPSAVVDNGGRPHLGPLMTSASGSPVSGTPLLQQAIKLVVLALPDLNVEGRCHFSETAAGETRGVEDEEGACAAILRRIAGRPVSLSEFSESLRDDHGFPLHRPAAKGPCPDTGVTSDHRLEKETCEKYHLSAWNRNYVTDALIENIRSLETSQQVGAAEETTHNSVQSRFADLNSHYYLLVMEGGTRLKVYEIKT